MKPTPSPKSTTLIARSEPFEHAITALDALFQKFTEQAIYLPVVIVGGLADRPSVEAIEQAIGKDNGNLFAFADLRDMSKGEQLAVIERCQRILEYYKAVVAVRKDDTDG